jgi:hypothetical protein
VQSHIETKRDECSHTHTQTHIPMCTYVLKTRTKYVFTDVHKYVYAVYILYNMFLLTYSNTYICVYMLREVT